MRTVDFSAVGRRTTGCSQLGGPLNGTALCIGKQGINNTRQWELLPPVITPAILVFLLCKRPTSRNSPPPSTRPVHFHKCTYNACSLLFNLFSSPSHDWILRATHCISAFVWVVLTQYLLPLIIVWPSPVWDREQLDIFLMQVSLYIVLIIRSMSLSQIHFWEVEKEKCPRASRNTKRQIATDKMF